MTKAFMPLLRKGKARIINTLSMGVKFSLPFFTPYFTTAYAIESYSESLRRELYHGDISVHVIEPGIFRTDILYRNRSEECAVKKLQNLPEEAKVFYGMEMIPQLLKCMKTTIANADISLVDAYQHALMSAYPKIRYKIGIHAWILIYIANVLPEWLLDFFYRILIS